MAITFRVNLQAPYFQANKQPYSRAEQDNFPFTDSTWLPNLNLGNMVLKNGDQFDVSGIQAVYLKDAYTTGPYAVLEVVSGAP